MRLTESAQNTILKIMEKQGLNPDKYYFNLAKPQQKNDGIGISFCEKTFGAVYTFGKLKITVDYDLDVSNLIIDTQAHNNKNYLVFKGE